MAKISELVKTFKLLSDPNAPDWNVKFVGGVVIALAIIGASGAFLWSAHGGGDPSVQAPAMAASQEQPTQAAPGDLTTCDPTEVAEALAASGQTSLPQGTVLPSGCAIG